MGAVERSENTDGSLASLITVTQKTRNDRSTDTGGNRTRLLAFIDIIHASSSFQVAEKKSSTEFREAGVRDLTYFKTTLFRRFLFFILGTHFVSLRLAFGEASFLSR